jgi:hypothetical protein
MDKMPLINLALQSFPESILLLLFGSGIFKRYPNIYRLLIGAALSSIISYFIRRLPFPYGVHALIGVAVLTLIFWLIFNLDFNQSLVASLATLATLGAIEIILLPVESHLLGLSRFSDAWPDPKLRLLMAIPELIILLLITYLLYRDNRCFKGDL